MYTIYLYTYLKIFIWKNYYYTISVEYKLLLVYVFNIVGVLSYVTALKFYVSMYHCQTN